jgi:hypothetical protein
MDETLRLLHPGWDGWLCLTRVRRRGQQSVNYVWKPVVSSLWAIPGPPLPDPWHRAAPEVLHAPPPVSLRRLRVARVVQSRRVRAASVAAHAPASPLIVRAGPQPHGRAIGADVPDRPTRQPSSGGGLTPLAASAARRRRAEQPDQEHDKSEQEHRSKQAAVRATFAVVACRARGLRHGSVSASRSSDPRPHAGGTAILDQDRTTTEIPGG